jgi:hypothetical protein
VKSLIKELVRIHGTATVHLCRSSAGSSGHDAVAQDDVLAVEVVVDKLDKQWWKRYRRHLEADLKQDWILICSSRSGWCCKEGAGILDHVSKMR